MIKPLQIGNVKLENNLILAPMAGITDLPFRKICKKFGPGLVETEMVSSKALYYGDEKTKKLLNMNGEKRPVSVQLFGSDIDALKKATEYVSNFADIIDINMGCPAPKIVKNGDGSKLLQNLDLIKKIATEVVKSSKVPVTFKIRKGWDKDSVVCVEVAKILEEAGAAAITIHGRTREDYFSGTCDLDSIKKVKEAVNIPVIGNGDIVDYESAKRMFEYTGVDGIMIGRGTLGNPWIFKEILTGAKVNVSPLEKLEIIKEHIELEVIEKGEEAGVKEMRKHIAWYVKNLKDATRIREKVNSITTKDELIDVLTKYFENL